MVEPRRGIVRACEQGAGRGQEAEAARGERCCSLRAVLESYRAVIDGALNGPAAQHWSVS